MNKIMVSLKDVSFNYHTLEGETQALKNISFDVYEGEFVGIIGPSGCGKSTLLSIISGLLKPSKGSVDVNGKIGYMLQKDHLFEWRNIWQNVLLGLEIQKSLTEESKKYVEGLLVKYGLGEFKNHYPNQLSGGMRQRAALIRTLALKPDILLLDEAFSALDYQTRLAISDEVYKILKYEQKTAIIVTHDISEAISMCDRIVVLSNRPAYVKKIYDIVLTCEDQSPIGRRKAPEFREYFNSIWKELDVHV
ncbi:MAG: ABC transporter related [Caldanaerobacter subterraneus]|jgi:NitT/TauT family transport system ATP-binding protein|uniref:ABC transporter related n=2 Tax=Thermoanaerobacter TaxID=1754 RepID=B0KB97_THEP3|nr:MULTISPECIES: ABC transporter ATP-binding protein [Thermoanaerobacter]KUJ90052.1 MAG: ABC transporter-like protein [Thermoanaerobacter thermocopriae]KUK35533.1 MAG: ABC transporter related [Caldanaerobacter subterraneus]ABY93557.1 ABC transporter related [Thermoanaerobacter sp. X514]ABY95285.1 ABC transporter related [Thermoanaerobacter pseudethanolicus ATCC 33223]ADV80228.1 ABC transporter related protein [Thermoanaerobacter brockii subsp. finnii Ako-1]